MGLIETSVKRPVGSIMIVIGILIIGFVSFSNLVLDLYPEIEAPVAVVATSYKGAAPQEVEKLVTEPMEGVLGTLEGMKSIRSSSSAESSLIMIQFDWGTDMDQKAMDIREKVDQIREYLPEDADEPSILKFDPNTLPIIQIALSGNVSQERLTYVAEEIATPELERALGVASVNLIGKETEAIFVEVNPDRLAQFNLTLAQIVQLISAENIQTSAGTLEKGDKNLLLRVDGSLDSIDDVKELLIPLPSGDLVRLSEIASITQEPQLRTSEARFNGVNTVTLSILKESDANTVTTADSVLETLASLKNRLPTGIQADVVLDLSVFIKQSIQTVISNLFLGGAISFVILMLFLKRLRPTIIIGITMPIAIIATFSLVYFGGQTLNMLTLGGLALGIGMMVDSSIVILENIFKQRERGVPMMEAAIEGTKEVGSAVIASALTTIAVFMPIVFVEGLAAELFRPLALTVAFSLLASLAVSITLVPMLSARLIKETDIKKENEKLWHNRLLIRFNQGIDRLTQGYKQVLQWAVGHRKTVVAITIISIAVSLGLYPFIGLEFIPAADQGEISIDVELAQGTRFEVTAATMTQLEERLAQYPEVASVLTQIGSGGNPFGPQSTDTNVGSFYVRLVPSAQRERTLEEMMEEFRKLKNQIAGVKLEVVDIQSGGLGDGTPISIKISGPDLTVLRNMADLVVSEVNQVEGTRNVEQSMQEGQPELRVLMDRTKAAQYGLTYSSVTQTVKAAFGGQVATRIKVEGRELDVRVSLPNEYKEELKNVGNLSIPTVSGILIPLNSVAQLKQIQSPAEINRDNQQRTVEITSDVSGRDIGSVNRDIQARLNNLNLPEGYLITTGGEIKDAEESISQLTMALILAIILVYIVMAVQFESFLYPFIIMFAMPATVIGVMLGLGLTGYALSVVSFIGIIILAGIVVNNAIVLVDYINLLRRRGMERDEAIFEAGTSRLRPILMTTLTTVLAMIPLALGIGEGAELQAPLANVVVFGLSLSTLVTLVFVPVIYTLFDDAERWIKRITTGA